MLTTPSARSTPKRESPMKDSPKREFQGTETRYAKLDDVIAKQKTQNVLSNQIKTYQLNDIKSVQRKSMVSTTSDKKSTPQK